LPDEWWTHLDLSIPESIDALDTPEACQRYVRRQCRALARAERDYEVLLETEGEAACAHVRERLDRLIDSTADAIHEVTRRQARLEVEAQRRKD
jgi:hypothetical protein